MLSNKVFSSASNDLDDWLKLGGGPENVPDGDAVLRVFGVTNDASASAAKIQAALVAEFSNRKVVVARFEGNLDTSAGRSAGFGGTGSSRAAVVTWDEGGTSLLDLLGSSKASDRKAEWYVGVTDMDSLTSIELFCAGSRKV